MASIVLRAPIEADHAAIFDVVAAAFGQADEAQLVDALRREGSVVAECVAVDAGEIVGHALCSALPIEREGGVVAAAALAPVAVRPDRQNAGIGDSVTRRVLDDCRGLGLAGVIVLGHENYYPRFGFSAAAAAPLNAPFSGPSFMAIEYQPGVFAAGGRVRYAPAFGIDE